MGGTNDGRNGHLHLVTYDWHLFSVTVAVPPAQHHHEVDLKPNGRHIPVTNDSVVEYIHRVADYRCDVWGVLRGQH